MLPDGPATPPFDVAPAKPALLTEPADPVVSGEVIGDPGAETGEVSICGEYPYPGGGAGSVRTTETFGEWPDKVGLAVSTIVVGVPRALPEIGTRTGVGFPGMKE